MSRAPKPTLIPQPQTVRPKPTLSPGTLNRRSAAHYLNPQPWNTNLLRGSVARPMQRGGMRLHLGCDRYAGSLHSGINPSVPIALMCSNRLDQSPFQSP